MKKLYLMGFLLVFTIIAINTSAQNYTISPSKTMNVDLSSTSEGTSYIYLNNTSGNQLNVMWVLIENTVEATGWDYNFCDIYQCYMPPHIPDSMQNTIEADTSAFFKLEVITNGIHASGTMKFYIYEIGNYENGDTLTYNVTRTVGIEDKELASFNMYPNPAIDQLIIKAEDLRSTTAHIYSMHGSLIKTYDLSMRNEATLDVSSLSTGSYVLVLQDSKGYLSRKVFQKD